MENHYANRASDQGPLGRLLEAGGGFFRPRARDFLRSQPNAVEAARRLGCTCADFSRLLLGWGMKGAALGSVKRHLAEMGRQGSFDENEVLRLMAAARAAGNDDKQSFPLGRHMPDTTSPARAVGTEQPTRASKGWLPRTNLGYVRPS